VSGILPSESEDPQSRQTKSLPSGKQLAEFDRRAEKRDGGLRLV
jgi:hypothetical protein